MIGVGKDLIVLWVHCIVGSRLSHLCVGYWDTGSIHGHESFFISQRRMLQLQGSRGSRHQFKGYFDCVIQTYRSHGIGRFYNGVTLNIVRMAPNTAIQFGTYEIFKQWSAQWF